jgi:hypothetical protein
MAWKTNTPLGTDNPSILDETIRNLSEGIRLLVTADHIADVSGGEVTDPDSGGGTHRKVTFGDFAADYNPALDQAGLYTKQVSGKPELFFYGYSSSELQLTQAGELKLGGSLVDDATLEVVDNTLQLKDGGISNDHISATAAIALSKIVTSGLGRIAIGSYTGNGQSAQEINLGFRPGFLLIYDSAELESGYPSYGFIYFDAWGANGAKQVGDKTFRNNIAMTSDGFSAKNITSYSLNLSGKPYAYLALKVL